MLETLQCNLTYLWCAAQSCHLLYTAGDATPSNLEEVTIRVGALTATDCNQLTFHTDVSPALKEAAFSSIGSLLRGSFILKGTSIHFYGS